MSTTHMFFIHAAIDTMDVFSMVTAASPHAVVAFGQPTSVAREGYIISAAECDSPLQGVIALTTWLGSPEWLMDHASGFVGPIRCAMAFHHRNDLELDIICTLGSSTAIAVIDRRNMQPLITVPEMLHPRDRYEVATPVLLNELVRLQDEDFAEALEDIFADITPGDLS